MPSACQVNVAQEKVPGMSELQRTFKPVNAEDIHPESLGRLSRSDEHRVR